MAKRDREVLDGIDLRKSGISIDIKQVYAEIVVRKNSLAVDRVSVVLGLHQMFDVAIFDDSGTDEGLGVRSVWCGDHPDHSWRKHPVHFADRALVVRDMLEAFQVLDSARHSTSDD